MDTLKLQRFAQEIRIETIHAMAAFGVGHIGGALSLAELLAVLYGEVMTVDPQNPKDTKRDWLVLSKGHCGPALYAALALKGFFPLSDLTTLNQPKTKLPSHCDKNLTPGIDMTTGSLGQGASSAAGIALGHKLDHKKQKTYLILGDGELQEGQVWEMALFAAANKLNNLIAFVDNNHLQLDDFTSKINSLDDIAKKFSAFGWYTQNACGHDVEAIAAAISNCLQNAEDKPSVVVLDTVKGKGWPAIENTIGSHSMSISTEASEETIKYLKQKIEELKIADEN